MRVSCCGSTLVAAVLAAHAAAQSYTETFEGGVNAGGWTIVGGPGGSVQPTGGNPGAYFGGTSFQYPDVQSRVRGEFTGDYGVRNVVRIKADFITFSHQGAIFPMTLALLCDSGTGDPNDDWGAYISGPPNVPNTGEGWKTIEFAIDAHAASLPAGWQMWDIGSNLPPVRDWPTLMQTVGQVRFLYAPPATISNFPVWNVGIDNIAIMEGGCYANCDGSTAAPILNVGDFVCFLNAYAAGQSTANCDGSTAAPVLNVGDFICFLNAYAAGCP